MLYPTSSFEQREENVKGIQGATKRRNRMDKERQKERERERERERDEKETATVTELADSR